MTDYYTQFVLSIEQVSAAVKTWAEQKCPAIAYSLEEQEEGNPPRWTMHLDSDTLPDLEEVIAFAQSYLQEFDPGAVICLEWANTCSKLRPDGFGGGAAVIGAIKVYTLHTHEWITQTLQTLSKVEYI